MRPPDLNDFNWPSLSHRSQVIVGWNFQVQIICMGGLGNWRIMCSWTLPNKRALEGKWHCPICAKEKHIPRCSRTKRIMKKSAPEKLIIPKNTKFNKKEKLLLCMMIHFYLHKD